MTSRNYISSILEIKKMWSNS